MADEPKKEHPEEIEAILSDLDAILAKPSDVQSAPKPAEPAKELPKIEAPVPKPEPPKAAPAPPATPAKTPPSIELAPREGMIKPPEKKPEPSKPASSAPASMAAPPPAPAPAPAAASVPAPLGAPAKTEALPADAPKEQIRRVAYIYTSPCSEAKTAFAVFLTQAARTISKKPLFLREVLSHEVSSASDPNAVLQKALQAKAAAILAVVEDWPAAKVDELSEACVRANVLFRTVTPADAQKKSTAVDIIVDMMLLPGEG